MQALIELEPKIRVVSEEARHYGAIMAAGRLSRISLLLNPQWFDPLLLDLIPRLLDPTPLQQEIDVATTRRVAHWYTMRDVSILLLLVLTFLVLSFGAGIYLGWWPSGLHNTIPLSLSLSILVDFALFSFWSFCILRIRWTRQHSEQVCTKLGLQLQDITREFLITSATNSNLPRDSSMALNVAADRIVKAVQKLVNTNQDAVDAIEVLNAEVI